MWFRHLDYPLDSAVTELGPAALDALLERGDLDAWAPLFHAIARDPWGQTADRALRVCQAHPMYGTSGLWQMWIARRRQRAVHSGMTLAQARARAGLTQGQVAARMGISQSDVSKLERRPDVRLSTLRAFAAAIDARLEVGLRVSDDGTVLPLVFPHLGEGGVPSNRANRSPRARVTPAR